MKSSFCLIVILLATSCFSVVSSQNVLNQNNYKVKFYWLNLHLSDTSTYLEGTTQIDVEIIENSDSLLLNMGSQLKVHNVRANGVYADFEHIGDSLFILHDFTTSNSDYKIIVSYAGDGNDSLNYGALHLRESDYGPVMYSLTEPFYSKYWFPCKEVLSDKADSVYVYATVAKGLKVGSNGLLDKVVNLGEDRQQYQWKSRYPISFYLISVAVGDFYDYSFRAALDSNGTETLVTNYIYNSENYLKNNKKDIDATKDMLFSFSEMFGVYPFYEEKYGHSLVPLGGGMEHQTMTTLGSFNFDLVSHELAHQWFGDYVTCKYWNDIWINEGFASYSEYLAREDLKDKQSAINWMKYAHDIVFEEEGGAVYVPEFEVGEQSRIFNHRLSYKKGSAIIHMIRYQLANDTVFFQVLREFLSRFAYSSATGEDFRLVLEEVSGISFDRFFEEWYYGEGYPILDYSWYQVGDTLVINTSQSASASYSTPFFHLKLPFNIVQPKGDTLLYFNMFKNTQSFETVINGPVYDVILNHQNDLLAKVYNNGNNTDSGDIVLHPILVYPNPAEEEIHVFSRKIHENIEFDVYDVTGRYIRSFYDINPQGASIALNEFDKGVYLFKIAGMDTNQVFRIIKK